MTASSRALLAACVTCLSCALLTQGYEDMMTVDFDNSYNEIVDMEEEPEETTTVAPCASRELSKWDKLFSMLENSQMRETMLLHSSDNVLRSELQALRDELLRRLDVLGASCSCQAAGARDVLAGLVDERLDQALEQLREVGEQQREALQLILSRTRGSSHRLSEVDPSAQALLNRVTTDESRQLERMLVAMATDLLKVKARVDLSLGSTALTVLPSGCEMALLFPMRSRKIFASVTPDATVSLQAFTVCLWAKATDTFNKTVLFSYGSRRNPHEIQLLLSGQAVLFTVGGEAHLVRAQLAAFPGRWVHYCGTWSSEQGLASLWVDGREMATSPGVAEERMLPSGGTMLLGQEKIDCCGMLGFDTFDAQLAFAGKMTGVNVWDRVLGAEEISHQAKQDNACNSRGNVVGWGISEFIPHGGAMFIG